MSGHQNPGKAETQTFHFAAFECPMTSAPVGGCGAAGAGNDFGRCTGTRTWTSGRAKLRDLGGSGICHFAGYWTDGGTENDRWVSVGNLTRTVDRRLGCIVAADSRIWRMDKLEPRTWITYRAYGMAGSWLEDDSLRANWRDEDEHSVYGNFALDKFESLQAPSNIGMLHN